MAGFRLLTEPVRIPVPGDKLIEELDGRVSTGETRFSLAHMVAPPGWSEPPQTPDFGELTIVLSGTMSVDVEGQTVAIEPGQAFWVEPGVTVRYANRSGAEAEYYAICLPAFSPEAAHRDEER